MPMRKAATGQSLSPISLSSPGSRHIISSVHFEDILMSLLQMITTCILHQVLIMIMFELKLPFMDSSVAVSDLWYLVSVLLNASHAVAEIHEKVLLQLEFSHGQDELKPQHFTVLMEFSGHDRLLNSLE
ncbi:hypothetical protein IMY05_006G0188900 [Salix suchowensis]|nr:hypothetical protein IMY05_006G0188900 [Salix suchowensis]